MSFSEVSCHMRIIDTPVIARRKLEGLEPAKEEVVDTFTSKVITPDNETLKACFP